MGSIIATQTTFCVVVEKDLYLKVLHKLNVEKVQRMTRFLRQIEFMQNWTNKEIANINYLLKLREFKNQGHVIMREGKPNQEVIIVKEGSVVLTKRSMSKVYMNQVSGII